MSEGALVRFSGVGKDYPKVDTTGNRLATLFGLVTGRADIPHFRALDGIDFEVRRGESLGIIGENGAGKSTLLKILAGVVKPTRGSVEVNGRVSALLELGSGFHPDYTGRENIYLSAALMGLARAQVREQVGAIIEFADIGEHIDQPIKHYSSGMVVRLGFAVASALKPEVLVTDEVLAVGDESFQKKCIRWLEGFRGDGGTLLLVSHSMYHIQTLCSRALWLDHGRLRMAGDSFEVTREYLSFHEEKTRRERQAPRPVSADAPRILDWWTEDASGREATTFAMGDDVVTEGIAFGPDGKAPVVLFGIVRADGTAIYGSHSNETGFSPREAAEGRFPFRLRFSAVSLLPGKYSLRVHALDSDGLRLFDTVEREFVITGRTRDYGFVRLAHDWSPGRGGRAHG